jgi:hypothetical protein
MFYMLLYMWISMCKCPGIMGSSRCAVCSLGVQQNIPVPREREVSVGIGVKWSQAERIVVCVLNSVRLMVHFCCVSINF